MNIKTTLSILAGAVCAAALIAFAPLSHDAPIACEGRAVDLDNIDLSGNFQLDLSLNAPETALFRETVDDKSYGQCDQEEVVATIQGMRQLLGEPTTIASIGLVQATDDDRLYRNFSCEAMQDTINALSIRVQLPNNYDLSMNPF